MNDVYSGFMLGSTACVSLSYWESKNMTLVAGMDTMESLAGLDAFAKWVRS